MWEENEDEEAPIFTGRSGRQGDPLVERIPAAVSFLKLFLMQAVVYLIIR